MHRRRLPSQWSDLPSELLSRIFGKLIGEFDDVFSCANVCASWRSVMGSLNTQFKRSKPFIIVSDEPQVGSVEEKDPPSQQYLHLFDTGRNKSHIIHLSQLSNQWFHGCSCGWLLTITSKFPYKPRLLNPLCRSVISLPSLGKRFERSFRVITSSGDPSHPDCVVLGGVLDPKEGMNMHRHDLLFCHPGNQTWKKVMIDVELDGIIWHDIILHKNQFYAVSDKFLYRVSLEGRAEKLISLPPYQETSFYLVEFNAELLLVVIRIYEGSSICIKLHQLKFDVENYWIEIMDLGSNVIYLARAHSVAARVEEHLQNSVICFIGCMPQRVSLKRGTQAQAQYLDFIVDTAYGDHPFDPYMSLLKTFGVFVLVGFPSDVKFNPASLIIGMKTISGSVTGGTNETQEMLYFCAAHKIYPQVELILIDHVNEALDRLINKDVQYRFVIDVENSLK